MRARHGLAQALWNKGLREEAVTHYLDMLRLNPGDNQGIRYVLIDYLLTLGRDDDAAKLMRRYKDDSAAAWAWSGALLAFRQSGDGLKSQKALADAMIGNVHVAALLLGDKKMPRKLPAYIGMGKRTRPSPMSTAPPRPGPPRRMRWLGSSDALMVAQLQAGRAVR